MKRAAQRRGLGCVRLSKMTDETTSPKRQRRAVTLKAELKGVDLVGWAEDLDVSASKTPPWERPELGKWLDIRPLPFDTIIFWKLDRFVRRVGDLAEMIKWCDTHKINLIAADGDFDLSTPEGRAMAYITAVFAELEAEAISSRVASFRDHARRTARWVGRIPYGYRASGTPGKLELDPDAAQTLRKIIGLILAGESVNSVATGLTMGGVPAPDQRPKAPGMADDAPLKPRRKTNGWSHSTLSKMLSSRSLLGQMSRNGEPVLDEEGMPIAFAEPIVSYEVWSQLQAKITANRGTGVPYRSRKTSPLLDVAFCAVCDRKLYRSYKNDGSGGYRCASLANTAVAKCGSREISARWLDAAVEDSFLHEVGDLEVLARVVHPAQDHTQELAQSKELLSMLMSKFASSPSRTVREVAEQQIATLEKRVMVLEEHPIVDAVVEYAPTGTTYGEMWRRGDEESRRQLLINAGVRVLAKAKHIQLQLPEDMARRLAAAAMSG